MIDNSEKSLNFAADRQHLAIGKQTFFALICTILAISIKTKQLWH